MKGATHPRHSAAKSWTTRRPRRMCDAVARATRSSDFDEELWRRPVEANALLSRRPEATPSLSDARFRGWRRSNRIAPRTCGTACSIWRSHQRLCADCEVLSDGGLAPRMSHIPGRGIASSSKKTVRAEPRTARDLNPTRARALQRVSALSHRSLPSGRRQCRASSSSGFANAIFEPI